jgi:hypothetical protein
VRWQIEANLGRHARTAVDTCGWLWKIARGAQTMRVVIEISERAWSSDLLTLPDNTRQAL